MGNTTNTFSGDPTVGTNGSFTLLVLNFNSLLTNSANGIIGLNPTARSNEVRLISASARWRVGGSFHARDRRGSARDRRGRLFFDFIKIAGKIGELGEDRNRTPNALLTARIGRFFRLVDILVDPFFDSWDQVFQLLGLHALSKTANKNKAFLALI